MKEFTMINVSKMQGFISVLTAVELKMALAVSMYLSSNGQSLLIHNAEFRSFLSSVGFSKTPERISIILSSLAKKGVLIRKASGVFLVPGNLFLPTDGCNE